MRLTKLIPLIITFMPLSSCSSPSGISSTSEVPFITSVTSSITTSEVPSTSETPIDEYDEEADSTEGIDTSDLSALHNAFSSISSYTSEIKTYFNEIGLYNYKRHYGKDYVQESVSLFSDESTYSYTNLSEYFDAINTGYINKNNNYYSFIKRGNTINERISASIRDEDLTLIKEESRYQDDVFSLYSLTSEYLSSKEFTRISKNKYQISDKAEIDKFVKICAPHLINTGYYMTFSRLTIELSPKEDVRFRIRLYASETQIGKMIETHKDMDNKPNWYLLFSEAIIK